MRTWPARGVKGCHIPPPTHKKKVFLGTTCTPFVTQPSTPCVPQSVSWWRCPVESSGLAQHFLAGLQPQTHFPFYPPFSLDPWICNDWCVSLWLLCPDGFSLVEPPLEFFQVQFPIAVVVESFHHSFHLSHKRGNLYTLSMEEASQEWFDFKPLLLNVMIQVSQFVSNSQLSH